MHALKSLKVRMLMAVLMMTFSFFVLLVNVLVVVRAGRPQDLLGFMLSVLCCAVWWTVLQMQSREYRKLKREKRRE